MQLVAPVVGEVASGGDRGAFLSGYQKAQQRAEEKKQEDAQTAQRTASAGASYLMDVTKHAEGITDPTDFENFLNMADAAGGPAGYTKPGQLRSTLKFSDAKQTEAQLKELNAQLDQLEKGGYDLDQLAESGSALHLRNGKTLPISTALDIARKRPTDASGTAVPKPKKAGDLPSLQKDTVLSKGKEILANFNPKDGKYYDLNGAVIPDATVVPKPIDPTLQALRELQLKNGQNGPRDRFNVQQVTNADGTVGLVRVNMETGETTRVTLPADTTGAGKPSSTEQLSSAFLIRTQAADKNLTPFETKVTSLGSQADLQLPTLLQSEQGQLYSQGRDEFINAALRRESGAAIQPSEYARFDKIYFVQPGDKPANIKQKQQARARVIAGFKTATGNLGKNASGPTIGEKRLINGQPAEWDGKGWKAVGGAAPAPVKAKAVPPGGGL